MGRPPQTTDGGDRLADQLPEGFLAAVLDTVDALIVVLDHEGRIVRFNRACEALTGRDRAELLGRPVWALLPEDEVESVRTVFEGLRAGDFPNRHENHWLTREGRKRLIEWSNTALLDEAGEVGYVVATGVDVTELRASQRRVQMFERIVSAAREHLSFVDRDYIYRAVNRAYLQAHRRSYHEIVGRPVADLLGEDVFHHIRPWLDRCLAGEQIGFQHWFDFPGAGRRYMDVSYSPACDADGGVPGVVVNSRDITDQLELETDRRLAAKVFQNAGDAILITDHSGIIIDVNPAFCEISGYAREEVIGRSAGVTRSGLHDRAFYEGMWGALREDGYWEGEIWDRRKGGQVYPKWLTITAVVDDTGRTTHYVGVFSDITVQAAERAELRHLAEHDPLTALPNRTLFFDRLRQALAQAEREGGTLAVLFIDLDHFKEVNDRFGHTTGDHLLQAIGERLCGAVRDMDTVCRFAGDEFTAILPGLSGRGTAAEVARKLLDGLNPPLELAGESLHITCSIGIALYPEAGCSTDGLAAQADAAAYRAKEAGRNTFAFADCR